MRCHNNTTLAFFTYSLYDSLNQFHNTFLTRFVTNPTFPNPQNGAFLDSCLGHCEAEPYDLSYV